MQYIFCTIYFALYFAQLPQIDTLGWLGEANINILCNIFCTIYLAIYILQNIFCNVFCTASPNWHPGLVRWSQHIKKLWKFQSELVKPRSVYVILLCTWMFVNATSVIWYYLLWELSKVTSCSYFRTYFCNIIKTGISTPMRCFFLSISLDFAIYFLSVL